MSTVADSQRNLELARARVDAALAIDDAIRKAFARSQAELDEALLALRDAEAAELLARHKAHHAVPEAV